MQLLERAHHARGHLVHAGRIAAGQRIEPDHVLAAGHVEQDHVVRAMFGHEANDRFGQVAVGIDQTDAAAGGDVLGDHVLD